MYIAKFSEIININSHNKSLLTNHPVEEINHYVINLDFIKELIFKDLKKFLRILKTMIVLKS